MNAPATAALAVRDQYGLGLGLFVAAPAAVALVVVPEFVQHVVEIRLGMFDGRAAARALAGDPTRWAFGYVKLAGLMLAFLACARAVWCGWEGGRWYDLRDVAWPRLLIGAVLFIAVGSLAEPLKGLLDRRVVFVLSLALSIASLPFLLLALGGLFGDRQTPWRPLATRGWRAVALLLLLLLTGFGAGQALHMANHLLALGAPAVVVWTLMTWDALVVGAIAALTGAAWALAYRAYRADAVARD